MRGLLFLDREHTGHTRFSRWPTAAEAAAAPVEWQEVLGSLFSFSACLAPADWAEPESLL